MKSSSADYDLVIRGGTIYDGSGGPAFLGDVAIEGDRIAAVGPPGNARGRSEIAADGLAVAPGFINVMSWAVESLIADGNSQSDIRQGVTLEVFGEGWVGPLNEAMKREWTERQEEFHYQIEWSTLGEYLDYLVRRGVSPNVASFLPASTVRIHELGYENRPPTAEELDRMRRLVAQAMEEGALGLAAALIYTPDCFNRTEELIALAEVAAAHGGMYISHLRSEGDRFVEGVDELITIARTARLPAEIYHLKAAGKANWHKMDTVIGMVEEARAQGLAISADMYTYTAGATGLDAAMPPWVQEDGHRAWVERLKDPAIRPRVREEMTRQNAGWENLMLAAGAENMLLVAFRNPALRSLTGKTLTEVAALRGKSPEETAMDLVIEDDSRVGTVYFLMSEENIRKQIQQPWVSFGSDADSIAPEGIFLASSTHPRTYGNFARLLAKYVREDRVISLEEAVRRLTSLPASNLKLNGRGWIRPGCFADVAIFDPAAIQDHATFSQPHQYSTGMVHVIVNGVPVLENAEHTGARPGRVVRRGEGQRRPSPHCLLNR